MHFPRQYHVTETDQFIPGDYPELVTELATMKEAMLPEPDYYRGEIVISYYKDHCLNHQWVITNPKLTKLVSTGTYKSTHIEALFEAGRQHPVFLRGYETYLMAALTDNSSYSASHARD